MKRIVVVLAIAALVALLVGGSLAAAAPQEPVAVSQQPVAVGAPEEGVDPLDHDLLLCDGGDVIHITGESHWFMKVNQPAAGARSESPKATTSDRCFL